MLAEEILKNPMLKSTAISDAGLTKQVEGALAATVTRDTVCLLLYVVPSLTTLSPTRTLTTHVRL